MKPSEMESAGLEPSSLTDFYISLKYVTHSQVKLKDYFSSENFSGSLWIPKQAGNRNRSENLYNVGFFLLFLHLELVYCGQFNGSIKWLN